MKFDEMETHRQRVHKRLCEHFRLEEPNGGIIEMNERYVNFPAVRNELIGQEITLSEGCIISLMSNLSTLNVPDCFSLFVRNATVHYAPFAYDNTPTVSSAGLLRNKPNRQLFEKVVRAFSPRNNLSWATQSAIDMCKMYNSVYKIVNLAHWTARNAVTKLLNEDIDNVHLHSSEVYQNVKTYMSSELNITLREVDQKFVNESIDAIDLLRYMRYVAAVRGWRRKIRQPIEDANSVKLSMRERLNNALWDIANCAPKNWESCLRGLPKLIARKKFPEGSIVAVELEFGCDDGSELQGMDESDYPDIPFVVWKGDGSVGSANGDGMATSCFQEVNIMFNPNDPSGWDAVKQCVDFLNKHGACVNSTCGMHVHIDTRNLTDGAYSRRINKFMNAYKNWAKYVVSRNRAHGHYCSINNSPRTRYCAINSCCRTEHRTLEVRIGHGTLNIHKIKAWVAFNLWLMNCKNAHAVSFDTFMQSDCPALIKAFIMSRMFKFADSWHSAGDSTPKTIKESVENTSDAWRV